LRKKRGNNFRLFEGRKKNDRHIRITQDMMDSPAWKRLKPTSIVLYLSIKLRFNGENQDSIEFPYTEAEKLGLSIETTKRCFTDLVDNGFIEIMQCGRFNRRANVYKLSSNWTCLK
jgi:hypothetical protein